MTQLRQKMLEELQRRHYSDRTAKTYIRIVRDFAAYFHQPPDQLGPEHIRQYQAYLFQSKKLSSATWAHAKLSSLTPLILHFHRRTIFESFMQTP